MKRIIALCLIISHAHAVRTEYEAGGHIMENVREQLTRTINLPGPLATDKKYRKRTAKDALGAAATFADSALFGAPSAIKPVAKSIERLERKNPGLWSLATVGGFLGGSALPGGAAIKALSKFKTANKLFNAGNKIKRGAAHGAVYGALQSAGKDIKTGQSFSDAAANALGEGAVGGALFGAGFVGAGKLAKMGWNQLRRTPKFALAKEKLLVIRKKLADKLSPRDIAHAKKLVATPEPFAGMKVNTLIHNPTKKTAAITDALFQRSPGARKILLNAKEKFGKKHFTSIEKMLLDETGGKYPSVEKFNEKMREIGTRAARPHYEKLYASGKMQIPTRLTEDPLYQAAVKKARASYNKLDLAKPEYAEDSARTVDLAKRYLQDSAGSFKRVGQYTDAGQHTKIAATARHELRKHAPEEYNKAAGIAKHYLKAEEAAERGLKFENVTPDEITQALGGKDVPKRIKEGFKIGVLEKTLNDTKKAAQNSLYPKLAKDFENKQMQNLFSAALGKDKAQALASKANILNKAHDAFDKYTGGWQTSLLGGQFAREAKQQMKALLNPKALLAAREHQAKEKLRSFALGTAYNTCKDFADAENPRHDYRAERNEIEERHAAAVKRRSDDIAAFKQAYTPEQRAAMSDDELMETVKRFRENRRTN